MLSPAVYLGPYALPSPLPLKTNPSAKAQGDQNLKIACNTPGMWCDASLSLCTHHIHCCIPSACLAECRVPVGAVPLPSMQNETMELGGLLVRSTTVECWSSAMKPMSRPSPCIRSATLWHCPPAIHAFHDLLGRFDGGLLPPTSVSH